MYSDEQYHKALEVYEKTKSVTKTVTILGYPSRRQTLYNWIHRKRILPEERSTFRGYNTEDHPRHHSLEQKLQILHRCFELGGVGRRCTISIKGEKAVISDTLKTNHSLPLLLQRLRIAKSSYYYQKKRLCFAEKHKDDCQVVACIFRNNGYGRIKAVLNREGYILSEKVVRRIIRQNGLLVKGRNARKCCSYKGEISPEVPNVIQRNFNADKLNQEWLTDATELSIPAGNVYLSPVIDCYDGMPIAWNISCKPDAQLVNTVLDGVTRSLPQGAHPILHSDRGCHYRWPGWIKWVDDAGVTTSMPRKGCSPDNSACEGFFGRMKNEMFYGRSWQGVTLENFM